MTYDKKYSQNSGLKIARVQDLRTVTSLDNNEKMINLSNFDENIICSYQNLDMYPYTGENIWVRETVALKLRRVVANLKNINPNLTLKIVYGYRSPEIQLNYFNEQKIKFTHDYPLDSNEELEEKIHQLIAVPDVAGHPTGGAVDLTIIENGVEIEMGTKIADFSDHEKINTFSKNIKESELKNRMFLHDFMINEGFAPFYGEWWHFCYGDKEWAWFYNKDEAIYDVKQSV